MSILSLLTELVECLDFCNAEAVKTLCDPILRWMFDERDSLQRLKPSSSELSPLDLEILWDIVLTRFRSTGLDSKHVTSEFLKRHLNPREFRYQRNKKFLFSTLYLPSKYVISDATNFELEAFKMPAGGFGKRFKQQATANASTVIDMSNLLGMNIYRMPLMA